MKKVETLEEYIKEISVLTKKIKEKNKVVVFRGENKDFGNTSCVPNIFRKNVLRENNRFEKNLFDEMKSNDLAHGNNYLEIAISAQHDGFPSRLLDVSYNCLVALYFACAPSKEAQDKSEMDDGKVFVFSIEKLFCPTGENIVNGYEEIIIGKNNSFIKNQIFAKNHKLIDHIKTNKRIIAQQGAFILFQGNYFEPLPKRICDVITIDHSAKIKICEDLNDLFGINKSSIYPQVENFVESMINKSQYVIDSTFCLDSELEMVLYNVEQDFEFYIDNIILNKGDAANIIFEMEKNLKDYMLGFENLEVSCCGNDEENKSVRNSIEKYNNIVKEEGEFLKEVLKSTSVKFNYENFEIM